MLFYVVAVVDSGEVDISRAQQSLLVRCEVALTNGFVMHEVAVRAFADACLWRWTSVEWHERVGTFGQIEECQVWLIPDFTVLSALITISVAWHQQPIQITFALSFKYISNYTSSSFCSFSSLDSP